jgi:hypothetical protein
MNPRPNIGLSSHVHPILISVLSFMLLSSALTHVVLLLVDVRSTSPFAGLAPVRRGPTIEHGLSGSSHLLLLCDGVLLDLKDRVFAS